MFMRFRLLVSLVTTVGKTRERNRRRMCNQFGELNMSLIELWVVLHRG